MKLDVKKFLIKLIVFIVIILLLIFTLLLNIFNIDNPKFKSSFQYAINLKYGKLVSTKSPKIIIVAGSSGAFGINQNILKEKTNMEVVNLGLHAGFGFLFPLNIARANISEGDLIVLAYEYQLYEVYDAEVELIMTGIDNNLKLYKYFPKYEIKKAIQYLPTYIIKKIDTKAEVSKNLYSINSFDDEGNLIYERNKCILPEEITEDYGKVEINKIEMDKIFIKEINNFYNYAKSKGAKVVISFPPILNERIYYDNENDLINFENKINNKLKPQLISHIKDYIFEKKYMYDTIYHCNNDGEIKRTEILAKDINNYLNSLEK